jgi:N-acylneuraminate cytidylyltransferase
MSRTARFSRRQDAPTFYDLTTVCYVMSPDYVMLHQHLFDGDIRMFHVPLQRSVDIDTIFDFELAEFIYHKTVKDVHE